MDNARWYDPQLGRFAQADTIVPGSQGTQAFDRYAYVNNSPVNYTDPTGHWFETALDIAGIAYDIYDIATNGLNWGNGLALVADVACTVLPVATGGGMAVRALMHVDEAVDAAKAVNVAVNAVQTANQVQDATSVINKVDIINDLADGTNQSKMIANAMQNGNIGFNILGDELFEKAYRHYGGEGAIDGIAAFNVGEQIYLSRNSSDIFRDVVHEGTHALDWINNLSGPTHLWEKRAYFFEHVFQLNDHPLKAGGLRKKTPLKGAVQAKAC